MYKVENQKKGIKKETEPWSAKTTSMKLWNRGLRFMDIQGRSLALEKCPGGECFLCTL